MEKERQRRRGFLLTFYGFPIIFLCTYSVMLNHLHSEVGTNNAISVIEFVLQSSVTSTQRKLKEFSFTNPKQAQWISERQNQSSDNTSYETNGNDKRDNAVIAFQPPLAGLRCDVHGGPGFEASKEMIYWENIPSDSRFVSPFKKDGVDQYITFEPDGGGWNNVRMSVETLVVMAIITGRTLVLPPEQRLWMLSATKTSEDGTNQRSTFSFSHFFHMERVASEHVGLEIITMQEFLEREALAGNIRDKNGSVTFPPGNRTNWNGADDVFALNGWLRESMHSPLWEPDKCMLAIPASTHPKDIQELKDMEFTVKKSGGFPNYLTYVGKPHPVDAPTIERLKENWAANSKVDKTLCVYDEEKQNAQVLHFPYDRHTPGARTLVHFYAFFFFQDWRQDLWVKRFVRDHLRYIDKIQCAAARIVHALREQVRARSGDPNGYFDSFHIRRGDFGSMTNTTQVDAISIYEISREELVKNATVYIATDERNFSYFYPLKQHYNLVFLHDFKEQLAGVDAFYYGMIEQLVVSRGRTFFGCFYSTFTGYINRIRGYHSNRIKAPGYKDGIIPSWYYAPKPQRNEMQLFYPVYQGYFYREFPTSWRLINQDIEEYL